MGENTGIEWATHTFNPWRGCTKVSEACRFCYAEAMSKRNPAVLGEWGDQGKRVIASEDYWRQPLKWNKQAEKAGQRARVFCASLADVFEDRPELDEPRARLFTLIGKTPHLDWLLLTKRPQNIAPLLDRLANGADPDLSVWDMLPLANVWFGTSVENQETADERIPHLIEVPAVEHFLSCEPLLGPVDLHPKCENCSGLGRRYDQTWRDENSWPCRSCEGTGRAKRIPSELTWCIVGGESGSNARPMHPAWARSLRDQCLDQGIAYFFKQWGELEPRERDDGRPFDSLSQRDFLVCKKGLVHSTQEVAGPGYACMSRVGKKKAGRLLDGRTWDELPGDEG